MGLRKALLIANSQYDDPTISRLAARNDSDALEQILKDKALGYFDQVLPLIDCRSDVVLGELQAFFSDENPTDLALVYFSGHGLVDDSGQLYLAMKNTKPKAYQATSIPASFVSEQINRSSSDRQVVILDCCYSGAFRRATITTPGCAVLMAGGETQLTWEGNVHIQGSKYALFSHFLISGLTTGAAVKDKDKDVTPGDLQRYISHEMKRVTSKQEPIANYYGRTDDIVIAHRAQNPGTIVNPTWRYWSIRRELALHHAAVIWRRVQLLLLTLLFVIALFAAVSYILLRSISPVPRPPDYGNYLASAQVGVAIVPFTVESAISQQQGMDFMQAFADPLDKELSDQANKLGLLYKKLFPNQIPEPITSGSSQTRANDARSRANYYASTILFFGQLSPAESGGYNVTLEFYVSPYSSHESAEMGGDFSLPAGTLQAHDDPQTQATLKQYGVLMADIAAGLSCFNQADSTHMDLYDKAAAEFTNAKNNLPADNKDGLTVLDVLLGNVYLQEARDMLNNLSTSSQERDALADLDRAQQLYLAHKDSYRAQAGLAAVWLARATAPSQLDTVHVQQTAACQALGGVERWDNLGNGLSAVTAAKNLPPPVLYDIQIKLFLIAASIYQQQWHEADCNTQAPRDAKQTAYTQMLYWTDKIIDPKGFKAAVADGAPDSFFALVAHAYLIREDIALSSNEPGQCTTTEQEVYNKAVAQLGKHLSGYDAVMLNFLLGYCFFTESNWEPAYQYLHQASRSFAANIPQPLQDEIIREMKEAESHLPATATASPGSG